MPEMPLFDGFPRFKAPETGRTVVQLTRGPGHAYPLYYFIPTFTADARYLIHHRAAGGEVQLVRLDLRTGESVQLTHALSPDTEWRPWCIPSGRGVLDHRSVLNVARNEVIYFDGNEARAVHVETLADRPLFTLPDDREAIGQNCATPDGRWFVYIHAPRGSQWGRPCQDAAVVAFDLDTGEHRNLCRIDSAIFHVTAYDNEHFIVTHPADQPGMMMTDLTSGGYVLLRDGDPGVRGHLIHCPITARGIAYEVPGVQISGLYDPFRRARFEFPLPSTSSTTTRAGTRKGGSGSTRIRPPTTTSPSTTCTPWCGLTVREASGCGSRAIGPRSPVAKRHISIRCSRPTAAGSSSPAATRPASPATSSCSTSPTSATAKASRPTS